MITVHRLNGKEFVVNCELIKFVEATPDTVITLSDNEKFMVKESVADVIAATRKYKQELFWFGGRQEPK
jgi:flagellar protein FlbD